MTRRQGWYPRWGKRAVDILAGSLLLLLVIPVMLGVALLVRLRIGSPVLFRQERPGLGGRPFVLSKFRTMTLARDDRGEWLPDAQRLTVLGRFLRATSLDELPELWAVVRGDMSLVGPRPLLMEYLPRFDAVQRRRHDVRPGITGLAQVNGRNGLSWEQKFEMDVHYVDHYSPGLDAVILARTFAQLLRPRGINAPGQATAGKFMGSSRE